MSFERQVDILVAVLLGMVVLVASVLVWAVSVKMALALSAIAFAAVIFIGREVVDLITDLIQ